MIKFPGFIEPISYRFHKGNRAYQEDSFGVLSLNNKLLLAITDGMGGHSSGELASRWLIDELYLSFKEGLSNDEVICQSFDNTQKKIQNTGKDMGCTVVVAIIEKKDSYFDITYTWIGDSRIYALSKQAEKINEKARLIGSIKEQNFWLLTEDDSFVWGFFSSNELSLDELTLHPNKNQLELSIHSNRRDIASIGTKRIKKIKLELNDKLFLCTDGVWETFIYQKDIGSILSRKNAYNEMIDHLKVSQKNDLLKDNNTFIISEMEDQIFNNKSYINKKRVRF